MIICLLCLSNHLVDKENSCYQYCSSEVCDRWSIAILTAWIFHSDNELMRKALFKRWIVEDTIDSLKVNREIHCKVHFALNWFLVHLILLWRYSRCDIITLEDWRIQVVSKYTFFWWDYIVKYHYSVSIEPVIYLISDGNVADKTWIGRVICLKDIYLRFHQSLTMSERHYLLNSNG